MGNNNCQECTNKEVHVINELLLDNKFFKDSIELNNPNTSETSKVNSLKVSREDLKKAIENTNLSKDYKDYIRKIVDDNELKESGTIEPLKLRMAKNNYLSDENNINESENALEQKKIIEEQREQILEQQKIIEEFKKKQELLGKDQQKKTKNESDQSLKVINLGLPKKENIEKEDKNNESQNKSEDINKKEENKNKEKNENSKTNEKEGEVKEKKEKSEKSEKEEQSLNIIPDQQEILDKKSKQEGSGNNDNKKKEEEKMEIQEDLNRVQSQKFKVETYEPVEQGSKIIYGNDDNNGSIEESNKKDDNNNNNNVNEDIYANTGSKKNEPKDSRRPVIQKGYENNNINDKIKQKKILRQKGPQDSERNNHELKKKADIHNENMNNKKKEMEGAVPKDSTRKALQPQKYNKYKKVSHHEQKIQLRLQKGDLNKNIDISNNLEVNPISDDISKFVSTQKNKNKQNINFNKINLIKNQMNPSEQADFIYQPQLRNFGLNQYQKYYSKKLNNTNNAVMNKSYQQFNNYRNNFKTNGNENYKGGESRSFHKE